MQQVSGRLGRQVQMICQRSIPGDSGTDDGVRPLVWADARLRSGVLHRIGSTAWQRGVVSAGPGLLFSIAGSGYNLAKLTDIDMSALGRHTERAKL